VTSVRVWNGRVHYAWIVFAVTFVTMIGAAGFRSTPGILMVPLGDEFGWSRATVGLAVSVNLLLFGFSGPFAAAAMLRFGVRQVVSFALATIAAGALLTTRMTEPWQLILLWGVVVGLGTGSMASVLAATVASRWFVSKRGVVVGLLTAASATGQLIFLPFLATLVSGPGGDSSRWPSQRGRCWRSCRSSCSCATGQPMSGCGPMAPARTIRPSRDRPATPSSPPSMGCEWHRPVAISGCWRGRSSSAD
jgi:MFS family permease